MVSPCKWQDFLRAVSKFAHQSEETTKVLCESEVFQKCAPVKTSSFLSNYTKYVDLLVENLGKLVEAVNKRFGTGAARVEYDGTPIIIFETVVTRLFVNLLHDQQRLENECKALSFLLTPLREVVRMLGKPDNPIKDLINDPEIHCIEGVTVLRNREIERIELNWYIYRQDEGKSHVQSKVSAVKNQTRRLASSFLNDPAQLEVFRRMEAKSVQKFEDDIYFYRAPVPYETLCEKWELEKKKTIANKGRRPLPPRFMATLPLAPLPGGPIKAGFEKYTASYLPPREFPRPKLFTPPKKTRPTKSNAHDSSSETSASRVQLKSPYAMHHQIPPAPQNLRKTPMARAQARNVRPLPPQRTAGPSSSIKDLVSPKRVRPMAVPHVSLLQPPKKPIPIPVLPVASHLLRKRPLTVTPARKEPNLLSELEIGPPSTNTYIPNSARLEEVVPAKRFQERLPDEASPEVKETPETKSSETVQPISESSAAPKDAEKVPETSNRPESPVPATTEVVPEVAPVTNELLNVPFDERQHPGLRSGSQSPELPSNITAAQYLSSFLVDSEYSTHVEPTLMEPKEAVVEGVKPIEKNWERNQVDEEDAAERERAEQKRIDDLRNVEDLRALGFFDQPGSDFHEDSMSPPGEEETEFISSAPDDVPRSHAPVESELTTFLPKPLGVDCPAGHSLLLQRLIDIQTPPPQNLEMVQQLTSSESVGTGEGSSSEAPVCEDPTRQISNEQATMGALEEVPTTEEIVSEPPRESKAAQIDEGIAEKPIEDANSVVPTHPDESSKGDEEKEAMHSSITQEFVPVPAGLPPPAAAVVISLAQQQPEDSDQFESSKEEETRSVGPNLPQEPQAKLDELSLPVGSNAVPQEHVEAKDQVIQTADADTEQEKNETEKCLEMPAEDSVGKNVKPVPSSECTAPCPIDSPKETESEGAADESIIIEKGQTVKVEETIGNPDELSECPKVESQGDKVPSQLEEPKDTTVSSEEAKETKRNDSPPSTTSIPSNPVEHSNDGEHAVQSKPVETTEMDERIEEKPLKDANSVVPTHPDETSKDEDEKEAIQPGITQGSELGTGDLPPPAVADVNSYAQKQPEDSDPVESPRKEEEEEVDKPRIPQEPHSKPDDLPSSATPLVQRVPEDPESGFFKKEEEKTAETIIPQETQSKPEKLSPPTATEAVPQVENEAERRDARSSELDTLNPSSLPKSESEKEDFPRNH